MGHLLTSERSLSSDFTPSESPGLASHLYATGHRSRITDGDSVTAGNILWP